MPGINLFGVLAAGLLSLPARAAVIGQTAVPAVAPVSAGFQAGAAPSAAPTSLSAPTLSAPSLAGPSLGLPRPAVGAPAVPAAPGHAARPAAAVVLAAPAAAAANAALPQALPGTAEAAPAAKAEAPPAVDAQAPASPDAAPASINGGRRALRILMAAAESHPFVKTGGLADVVDDLGRGLAAQGHEVTLILPKFPGIDHERFGLREVPGSFQVPVGGRMETARLWKAERGGMEVYFLQHPGFYSRPGPYGYDGYDGYGRRDYPDNDERFLFHARAALEAMKFLGRPPDIVHAHDWHVGLIPALLKTVYAGDPFFAAARSLMTIHNIAYQGLFPWTALAKTGLAAEGERPAAYAQHGMFSYLRAGLESADALTTVSPTYAREIQTERYGESLQDLLVRRAPGLTGILNGIDTVENDPAGDKNVFQNYGPDDAGPGKAANKAELQRRLGLAADPGAPVYAVASRFAHQKGIDLVLEAADAVLAAGGQLVLTGSGERELEDAVLGLAARHPGRVARHAFDTVFVKLVYAGADFLLMPSRFEPCGLSQLIAQRYGTLPIATRTGGLADTISDGVDGFHVPEFSVAALRDAIARAASLFSDPEAFPRARAAAMAKDSSWGASIARYLGLYRALLAR